MAHRNQKESVVSKQRIPLIESLVPFLILGVSIAVFIAIMILLSYVLIWGVLIGGVIWAFMLIKEKIFGKKKVSASKQEHQGRVIDYDDIK